MFMRTRADEVTAELGELAAHVNAAHARMLDLLLEADELGAWGGIGIRSIGHWASLALGLHPRRTNELLACARSLRELPAIREGLASGELSIDKVVAIARVATSETEADWFRIARDASTTQLCRIAAKYVTVCRQADAEDGPPADAHERRSLSWRDDPDGMVRLLAVLSPEDAAVVRAAIETAVEQQWRGGNREEPAAARAADGLVAVAEAALGVEPRPDDSGERTQVVVHVDADYLAGARTDGRCHLMSGSRLDRDTVRRLACDAVLIALTERDGQPIDVGRARRVVNRAQRRALRARDGGCAFPGCSATLFLDAHHIDHWVDGGPTDLANLLLLCRFHHRLHHEGRYRIERTETGELLFLTPHGRPVTPVRQDFRCRPTDLRDRQEAAGYRPTWLTAHAKDPMSGTINDAADGLLKRRPDPPPSGPRRADE